ncbi:hypothetical protein B0H16DRAFT_1307963 [Mycena metata]|uniref:CxC1-like cysteine cluster associated with KDZ transposases domain-containing protein n=1 Tax=Mycena metata TaxID=1033252 RepID=A0AAD7JPB0_9AGAR|nr:hypothetical protein B0H16DRAFT_1307963 [Mycena metata]
MVAGDEFIASGLVSRGFFPCSSKDAQVVITTRTLEFFRAAHLRAPRLTIQSFTRTLCDLHGVLFRPYLATQFSVSFDIYLDCLARVKQKVHVALGRDTPDWRLGNACPACLYKLEGEEVLEIPVLTTMDSNNSLKRFERRERTAGIAPGPSQEQEDERKVPGDYYLSREEVDRWGKDQLDELMKGFVPDAYDEEKDGCSDRWQNMKESVTGKVWAMYEETGIFLSLCCHGFVLLVADMVCSGELAKYGFVVVNHLIKVIGELGDGYDIGCEFGKMINKHPVLGPLARANKFRSLVGAFHGHLCQLCNLATYVRGVSLEDLEYCKTFFSKSNVLAASTRHATHFHRQQTIVNYLEHSDTFEAYASLCNPQLPYSALLVRKYKRALEVKATEPALEETMRQLNIQSKDEFAGWLAAEKAALTNRMWRPPSETLAMEYYQKLVNLAELKEQMDIILRTEIPPETGNEAYGVVAARTRHIKRQRRHIIARYDKTFLAVQDLENRLDISVPWVPGNEQYEAARVNVVKRRYQRALDKLQALVISRMFELTKMNMSGMGYKLRKHIAKALQARSRAIKVALQNYNDVAPMMDADPLSWEEVVEYTFLSQFDILRDGCDDIRMYPWAKPSGRIAMDQYFKIERANEEIIRLNIEVRRVITHIHDEAAFLRRAEVAVREKQGKVLAHQVFKYRMLRGRFADEHLQRFNALGKVRGFTGTLFPGIAVNKERLGEVSLPEMPLAFPRAPLDAVVALEDGEAEEEEDEQDEQDLMDQFTVLTIAQDLEGDREE